MSPLLSRLSPSERIPLEGTALPWLNCGELSPGRPSDVNLSVHTEVCRYIPVRTPVIAAPSSEAADRPCNVCLEDTAATVVMYTGLANAQAHNGANVREPCAV
jgi:hypothetical protein